MRKFVSAVAVLFFSITLNISGQQGQLDPNQVQVKVQKLSGNVYMLQFVGSKPGAAGGDVGAFVGPDGIAIVDAGYEVLAPKLDAALKTIADRPVKYIFNTHGHGDHAGGDGHFAKTATIIGNEFAVKQLTTANGTASAAAALAPAIGFDKELILHFGGEEIRALHFAHGHTAGDSVVFFTKANVVQMGDDFVYPEFPAFIPIDMQNDGSGGVEGAIAAAEYVLANTPDDVKIIPGHGDLATKSDLRKALTVLKDTSAVIQAGIAKGRTLDQLKQEGALAPWDYLNKSGHIQSGAYFERLYKDLASKANSPK